jgi:hypothetical protein
VSLLHEILHPRPAAGDGYRPIPFHFSPSHLRCYNAGMSYSLRSLMIVVLVLPPLLAGIVYLLLAFERSFQEWRMP